MKLRILIAVGIFMLFYLNAWTKITLPSLLCDHMVLQQNARVTLWGSSGKSVVVNVTTSWDKRTYTTHSDLKGDFSLQIKTPSAGGPYLISFNDGSLLTLADILIGEVWVCSGQSNMEMPVRGFPFQPILNSKEIIATAGNPQIRLFKVARNVSLAPLADVTGNWKLANAENVTDFSALAYEYGRTLQQVLKVPVGLISSNVGGTRIQAWMSARSLETFSDVNIPNNLTASKQAHKEPTALFNSMIAPLMKLPIKGVIWCQGESNRDQNRVYAQLFSTMVADWRKQWSLGDFPFYYVQIAPFGGSDKQNSGVLLREAQQDALRFIPNSAMVTTIDVGMEKFIHYMDKTTPAIRLANLALGNTYGMNSVPYKSPTYHQMRLNDEKIELIFNDVAKGLVLKTELVDLFELAGDDKIFYPAVATIKSQNTIELHSPKVRKPVAARYAFKNWVVGQLYNSEGLPASSFRTDNW